MTDIVLVNARCETLGARVRLEHLGLGYLAATLRQAGHAVEVIDGNFHDQDAGEVAAAILAQPSRAVGFSVFLNNARETRAILDLMGAEGARRHITLGGHHPTFNRDHILMRHPVVDSIVMGEGEVALTGLMGALSGEGDWRGVAGVAYAEGDEVVSNPCPPLVGDLDSLPFPGREPYATHLRQQGLATMLSSRGCYGACTFCSIRPFYGMSPGRAWRARSAESVVDEMEYLGREYGVRRIEFADDNLIGPGAAGRERAWAIGEEMLRRGLDMKFLFICRADDVDEELLGLLQRAGLEGVDIGVESWVPAHLELYRKGVTAETNREAIEKLKRLGLAKRFYLIPSNPYATLDEIGVNLAEADAVGLGHFPESAVFNRLTVFRGSPIEETLRRDGLLEPEPDSDGLGGLIPYRFRHEATARFHALAEVAFQDYLGLSRTITATFRTAECQQLEARFAEDLKLGLRQEVLGLLRGALAALRRGDETGAARGVETGLEPLRELTERIVAQHERGDFHRFAAMAVAVGGHMVRYPPEDIAELAATLWDGP